MKVRKCPLESLVAFWVESFPYAGFLVERKCPIEPLEAFWVECFPFAGFLVERKCPLEPLEAFWVESFPFAGEKPFSKKYKCREVVKKYDAAFDAG